MCNEMKPIKSALDNHLCRICADRAFFDPFR